jgi:formate dehydrogenase iron-sulfur subunit
MSRAVLVDLTKCFGCGACTVACKLWNEKKYDDAKKPTVGENAKLCDINWTVVDKHVVKDASGKDAWRFAKKQCLHCNEPACASSCLVGALRKTEDGPVVYSPDLCVGCRYCMVACPFNIPTYEWERSFPEVSKCQMCSTRVARNEMPACVSVCPNQVMKFGERDQLLKEAHTLIASNSLYIKHVYGEKEVGGTAWMYVSDQPFEKLGYRTAVRNEPLPAYTWKILNKIPAALIGWTGILTGIYLFTKRRDAVRASKKDKEREK